jgi:hypothetical protein
MRNALLAVLIFVAGLGTGWTINGWRLTAQIEHDAAERNAATAHTATAAVNRLAAAQRRGDELVLRIAAAELEQTRIAEEKDREIRRLTVGRRCLDGAAVRLLNQPAGAGLGHAGAVPQAAGQPVPDDAAFATDTDVGIWVGQCRRAYDTCRGRLQGIADFYAGEELTNPSASPGAAK